jgi:hypothetical protein
MDRAVGFEPPTAAAVAFLGRSFTRKGGGWMWNWDFNNYV